MSYAKEFIGRTVTGRVKRAVYLLILCLTIGANWFGVIDFKNFKAQAQTSGSCAGIVVTPSDDLRALAAASAEGTTFCLQPGVYRNVSVEPRANQKFIGTSGVIFNGARVLTNFVRDGNLWKINGQTQQGQIHANDACKSGVPRCGYPEDLFFDNQLLLHVANKTDVAAGKWFFDYAADTIYIGNDPAGHTVETSVTRSAFAAPQRGNRANSPNIPGVTIENIIVEKYAVPAQMGAIGDQFASSSWTIRNCETRLNHGTGINLWHNSQALNNHAHHNGHNGISGSGDDILVQDNRINHNNTAGYNPGWEGGAGKFSYTNRLIYRRNYVHDNYGFGAWTDIENRNTLVEDNLVENNEGPGIMHEISYQAVIRNNIVRGNGRKGDYVYSAEILISSSRDTEVYGNRVTVGASSGQQDVLPNTRMGIIILQGDRDCNGTRCQSVNNNIHDNTVTYTALQQVLERGAGISGSGIFSDGNAAALANNTFDRNIYVAPDCAQRRWFWLTPGPGTGSGHWNNFTEFQQSGFEINGRCVAPVAAGTYRIIPAVNAGAALDVSGVSSSNGAHLHEWAWHGGNNQRWQITTLGNGFYRLSPAHNSGAAIDVDYARTADGTRVHQWTWHGGANQQWQLEPLSDGSYRLTPGSNPYAALDLQNARPENGTRVQQWTWHGGIGQKWMLSPL